jgi:transposase-like protein
MRMQSHTHVDLSKASFPELDALRGQLRLSQAYVCRKADLNPTTYTRWRKWAHGKKGGNCPQSRSLRGVRELLARELSNAAPPST